MKTSQLPQTNQRWLVSVAIILSAVSLAAAEFDSDIKKSFSVKPGGEVVLDVDSGNVEVTTGGSGEVVIEVKRRQDKRTLSGSADAEKIFQAHEVKFDQDGDQVRVTAAYRSDAKKLLKGRSSMQVNYLVQVPKQFNLNLKTAAGNVGVAAIEGNVKVKTSGGNLKFGAITGSVEANSAAGNISAEGATGRGSFKTSGGNINLGSLAEEATADTAAGSISVKEAKGKLMLKSSGGDIELGEAMGPATLSTAAGSIRVKSAAAALSVKTSGGNIKIEDAREAVQAQTAAGSITAGFSAQPKGDCKLTTSGGNIEVQLAEKLAFDVDAHTTGGHVSSELPIEQSSGRSTDTLKGKVNGGGVALVAHTSAGNVKLVRR